TANCSFSVVVEDHELPVPHCPAGLVFNTDGGQCNKTNVTYTISATDNCPGASVVCEPVSGSTFAKGVSAVTCTATDASGNTNQCTFTVTINDTEAPVITCPADIVANTDGGQCSKSNVTYTAATAADNCPGVTVDCSPLTGTTFAKGTNTVICIATDSS